MTSANSASQRIETERVDRPMPATVFIIDEN